MFTACRHHSGILALCLGLLVRPVPGDAQEPALLKARSLLSSGRYRDARRLAAERLAGAPSSAEPAVWKWVIAESYQLEGDYEAAEGAYEGLTSTGPEWMAVDAGLEMAKCRIRMWDGKAALEALNRIPEKGLGPRAWKLDELEAVAFFVSGKQKAALEKLEALSERSAAGWHYMGLILLDSGQLERALECFRQALEASPGDYYDLLYRASCLIRLHRVEDARQALEAVRKVADTPEVNLLLGRLELRAERFDRAESALRKAVRMSPENAEAHFSLMTVLRRQEKTEAARGAARKFRELHARQQEHMTYAYRLSQEHESRPGDPVPAEKLALHYYRTRDPAAAERMAWKALRLAPGRTAARLCLARTCAMVGRYREAAVHYRKILRRQPDHSEAEQELRELIRQHARPAGRDRPDD